MPKTPSPSPLHAQTHFPSHLHAQTHFPSPPSVKCSLSDMLHQSTSSLVTKTSPGIIKESIKLISKNGKLAAFIIRVTFILTTVFFLVNFFSILPLIDDIIKDLTVNRNYFIPMARSLASNSANLPPGSIQKDIGILLIVELAFMISYVPIAIFSSTATITMSATSYNNKTLSIKELVFQVKKSWIRPFITWFYMTIIGIGYSSVLFLGIMTITMIFSDNHVAYIVIVIVFGTVFVILGVYFTVIWMLALVISVVEENCYGFMALGKAVMLTRGKRLKCFILSFLFMFLSGIISQGLGMTGNEKGFWFLILRGVIQTNIIQIVQLFQCVTYSVVYFHCENPGEMIETEGSTEYSIISSTEIP